jgi:hypothetical protein
MLEALGHTTRFQADNPLERAMRTAFGLAFLLYFTCGGVPDDDAKPSVAAIEPDPSCKRLGRSLWFDPKEKRLYLKAKVVLREGYLEHLLCLRGTKEHEAIVSTDAAPWQIHTGLLLTGAKPGHPVQFVPKFEPPTGSAIAIEASWLQEGKTKKADVRQWIKDEKKAPLSRDWVFGGSQFYDDAVAKKPRYAAEDGDLITVANFGSAILDLPIESSANDSDRTFSTNTEKIPPIGTELFLSLAPRQAKKATAKPAAQPSKSR